MSATPWCSTRCASSRTWEHTVIFLIGDFTSLNRRPVRPQQHPAAAHARADQGQRRDLLQAGQPGARPGQDGDPLQQRVERPAGRARHDPAGGQVHRGPHDGARRLHQALRRADAHQRARVPVPADAGLRLGGAQERHRAGGHRPEVQPAGGAPPAAGVRPGAAVHPDHAAAGGPGRHRERCPSPRTTTWPSPSRPTRCTPRSCRSATCRCGSGSRC